MDEIRMEEDNLSLIARHGERAMRLIPLLVALLVINIVLAFYMPDYVIYWIVIGFFVYMYYFIVLLFPTTRRIRTPGEKKAGAKGKRNWGRGAKTAVMKGKRSVTIAFWNSFFIGTLTLAKGIAMMLAISIVFSILALAEGTLDRYSAAIVVAQSLAIMGFYYVIIWLRPYSKDFLRTVARLRAGGGRWVRWQAYLKGALVALVLLTVFVVFIISAIFIPKRSVEAVISHLGSDAGLMMVTAAFIFISQFFLVRYVQGFDSARMTTRFIMDKLRFLDRDVLGELDRAEGAGTDEERVARSRSAGVRFHSSRIYKVVYKDIFGILPTYPIIVDFRSMLENEVADVLGEEIPLDIAFDEAA